jgi:hypothetical protein
MRYGTVTAWAEYLEKVEGISIHQETIRRRLKRAEAIGVDGRTRMGIVFKRSFFSEASIRESCADLLKKLPKVDESGFFEKNDIRYGTISAWARELKISNGTISARLQMANIPWIYAKSINCTILKFYTKQDIKRACADLIEDLTQVDEDGFFEKDGMKYGTIRAWARYFQPSSRTIKSRILKNNTPYIYGKDGNRSKRRFYSEIHIRVACADTIDDLPKADESGFFEKDGMRYGTITAWTNALPISTCGIKARIQKFAVTHIHGKNMIGRIFQFYAENDIKKACADFLKVFPQADKTGFFKKNGQKYGNLKAWSKVLPISPQTIQRRLEQFQIEGIKGKTSGGQVRDYYAEPDVLSACADILQRRNTPNPKAA